MQEWLRSTIVFWGTYYLASGLFLVWQYYFPTSYNRFLIKPRYKFKTKDILYMYGILLCNTVVSASIFYVIWWSPPQSQPGSWFDTLGIWIVSFMISIVWFHYTHWLCHLSSWIWKYVHYLHHTYTPPIALQTLFVHPGELILVFLPATLLGPKVTNMSINQFHVWLVILCMQGILSHSGLDLSPSWFKSMPMSNALRHDLHHSLIKYNYGAIPRLDKYHQTEFVHVANAL